MGSSPVAVMVIIAITSTMVALIGGSELVEESYPDFGDSGDFGGLDVIGDIISAIFGTVAYVFNLLTFNIDGAPWFIRVPIGIALGGSLVWAIATLIRGN